MKPTFFSLSYACLLLLFPLALAAQQDTLYYVGSSTISNFLREAEPIYRRIHFIWNTEPESVGGELAILEAQADLAGTAQLPGRALRERKDIHKTLIGWDAIALVVHPSNPVQNLTRDQLLNIFTGQIVNWKEVGGPDLPIHPYIVAQGSATRRVFRSAVLGAADYRGCKVVAPDELLPQMVQNDPGAIGHISLSFLSSIKNVHVLSVDGQLPDLDNPSYPITRPLYLLWRDEPASVAEFVSWAISPAGQQVVMRHFIGLQGVGKDQAGEKGKLMVYTETRPVEDGGIFFYPHQPYLLYNYAGELIREVSNHLSDNDEWPTRLELDPGIYQVRSADGNEQAWVSVQPGKLSVLDLELVRADDGSKLDQAREKNSSLTPSLRPYGDFRVRQEFDSPQNRLRMRYRIRGGVQLALQSDLSLNFRLGSSNNPDDPNSTHVNVSDGFNQIGLIIDRAHLRWKPRSLSGTTFWLGRFPHGFVSSGVYSELVWDNDIQADGLAFSYLPSGKFYRLYFGFYLLGNFYRNRQNLYITTGQWMLKGRLSPNATLQWLSGFYWYSGIKELRFSDAPFDANRGNSSKTLAGGEEAYVSDFHLSNQVLALRLGPHLKKPYLKVQWIHNFGANNENNGWSAGFSLGDLSRKKHWKIYYQFQHIERDAVFSPFVNDDMPLATAYEGHVGGLGYALSDAVVLHAWGLYGSSLSVFTPQRVLRFRLDLDVKFK